MMIPLMEETVDELLLLLPLLPVLFQKSIVFCHDDVDDDGRNCCFKCKPLRYDSSTITITNITMNHCFTRTYHRDDLAGADTIDSVLVVVAAVDVVVVAELDDDDDDDDVVGGSVVLFLGTISNTKIDSFDSKIPVR
jgi:hypothetical protein